MPDAEVMQPSISTSEPLKPGKGRVRGRIRRVAQLIHARLSSSAWFVRKAREICVLTVLT